MNEWEIEKQYADLSDLLEEKRLKEALTMIEPLIQEASNWDLQTRFDELQTSYQYLLDYLKQGVDDPKRWDLQRKMLADTWTIADQARNLLNEKVSSKYYYELRRNAKAGLIPAYDLADILRKLEAFNDDYTVSQLISNNAVDDVAKKHEEAYAFLFKQTWANTAWTQQNVQDAQLFLKSEQLLTEDLCLFVSSVLVSLTTCFDINKVLWLFDAYQHPNPEVSQRALVVLLIGLQVHHARYSYYPELAHRFSLMSENATFAKDVICIQRQMLMCQETKKIEKKMMEEIIPEMVKGVSSSMPGRKPKGKKEDDDEEDNNDDSNPDWHDLFENSKFEESMKEMEKLQREGADIHMGTFSSLKGFPFFREPQNWFYPFSDKQSAVIKANRKSGDEKGGHPLMEIILKSSMFCDSDKYSFFFSVQHVSKSNIDMLKGQLNEQELELIKEGDETSKSSTGRLSSVISNNYLHDIYRFCNLYIERYHFTELFKETLILYTSPLMSNLLMKKDVLLSNVQFFFKKGRWDEAINTLEFILEHYKFEEHGADLYQQYGYVLQKGGFCDEAIEAYLKADMLKPDCAWTNLHLATCYRRELFFDKALEYYKKYEESDSNNTQVIFQIGNCYVQLDQPEPALNYFFKLDFLSENNVKAWRGIGWCSLKCGKTEQSLKYYKKVVGNNPTREDYANAGHAAWGMKNLELAVRYYRHALQLHKNKDDMLFMLQSDEKLLRLNGVETNDIPFILDLL